ncbi:subtilisin-like protease SBT3 [Populus alba x Populus x berolinensis]|nr:subtilisin-like protease SBT3 [Populus alba x Populus x berolinensis]
MPKAFSGQYHWYLSTLASIFEVSDSSTTRAASATLTASSKLLYSYTHVINGFSASLTPSELEVLKNSPGYISSIKDLPVKHDTTHSSKFLGLTPQSLAWKVSNYGDGIIIGLVDSGVWPESQSYNDHGMSEIPKRWKGECESGTQFNSSLCNKKLIGARSFSRPQASVEFRKTNLGIKSAPSVTGYSSRGPSASCPSVMKPDIMTPGSLILASWPPNVVVGLNNSQPLFSNFNIISGTSMACPHAAGVAALLRKAHPDWSPAAIRSAMMTTADIMDHTMKPINDIGFGNKTTPASPLAMGAGQVNPNKALDPGLIYDVNSNDYVRLLCALNFTEKQIQAITRSSSTNCSNPSTDLNYPSFIAYFNAKDSPSNLTTVREFQRTVTNVGAEMSTYTVNVTPMIGLKVSVVPDKLEFRAKYEKLSYKLIIEGPALLDETVTFGYLSWVDVGCEHIVRSPIVSTSLSPQLSSKN